MNTIKRFHVTIMCGGCIEKITLALKKNGYQDFRIDFNTSILEFENDVSPSDVINVVRKINYKIEVINDLEKEDDVITEDEIYSQYYNNIFYDKEIK